MSRSLFAKLHRRFGDRPSAAEVHASVRETLRQGLQNHPALRDIEVLDLRKVTADPLDVSVAIIGGGFAGLMAGYALVKQGLSVTVFEGAARVGGRVHSLVDNDFVPGRIVEGGAELIGSNHPLWIHFC